MALPGGFIWIVAGYAASAILALIIIATLQRGFLGPWLRVKGSRGKKVLVRVVTLTDDYFKVGRVDEGMLFFRDRTKENRMVTLPKGSIYDSYGVKCVDLDDERNTVFNRETWQVVNGYDAKQIDAIFQRILLRPGKNNKYFIVIIVLVAVVALLCLANAYMSYKIYTMVSQLGGVASSTISTTPLA